MIAELKQSAPAVQQEMVRALVARNAKSALPALIEAGRGEIDGVRKEAIVALGKLGDYMGAIGVFGQCFDRLWVDKLPVVWVRELADDELFLGDDVWVRLVIVFKSLGIALDLLALLGLL